MLFIAIILVIGIVIVVVNYTIVRPNFERYGIPAMRGWVDRQPASTDEAATAKCRAAVRIGSAVLNWPIGRIQIRGDQLLVNIGILAYLLRIHPRTPNLPTVLGIRREEITRLMRTGGLSQYGLRIQVRRGDVIELWGPSVVKTFATLCVSDVPIESSRRRFFSGLDLTRPGDPFDKQ